MALAWRMGLHSCGGRLRPSRRKLRPRPSKRELRPRPKKDFADAEAQVAQVEAGLWNRRLVGTAARLGKARHGKATITSRMVRQRQHMRPGPRLAPAPNSNFQRHKRGRNKARASSSSVLRRKVRARSATTHEAGKWQQQRRGQRLRHQRGSRTLKQRCRCKVQHVQWWK